MSKALWACLLCGEDFTRRSSGERHRKNVHQGKSVLVRFVEYLAGRASGLYPKPIDPPRLSRRGRPQFGKTRINASDMTVADSTTKDFWWCANNDQSLQLQDSSYQSNNQTSPLDESIRYAKKLLQFKRLMNQHSNQSFPFLLPNVNLPISISKAVGFRGELCDTCLIGKVEPIFSFDRLESLVRTSHTCNPQDLSKIRNIADISNAISKFHERFISSFVQLISCCIGSQHIFLTAQEILPLCAGSPQDMVANILPFSKMVLSKDAHFDLGRVSNNHWAHRASTGQDHKTILSRQELVDFLNYTKSTFGAFQVELEDGLQHYLLLYINF